jgi:hypothetical protein
MDPIGPWYATFNRLAAPAGIISTFQNATANASTDPVGHQLSAVAVNAQTVPSTTASQILLQTGSPTAVTLAGQSASFNPGGFLASSSVVGFDTFVPFSHHKNPKETLHYAPQLTQPITTAQVVTISKPSSPVQSDIPALRNNFASPQPNEVSTIFYMMSYLIPMTILIF